MNLILSCFVALGAWVVIAASDESAPSASELLYHNYREPEGPWSVHVVRVPRRGKPKFEIQSVHADGRAIGLSPLSEQTWVLGFTNGTPMAAINGDFYQRDGPFAGDPRGLQIVEGELISAPAGTPSFWIDAIGEPHATKTESLLQVTWPDGTSTPLGLNGTRPFRGVELYTPVLGSTTRTAGGRELVLEQPGPRPWLALRPGKTYSLRIRAIREAGNTPVLPGTVVLSLGPGAKIPKDLEKGAELVISTATIPNLRGAKTAISGGPVLIRDGKRQRISTGDSDSYQFSSMAERHPRSVIGWNDDYYFLVTVDGRQRNSVGMTLDELAAWMAKLGCGNAVNLDGGGSATLWYDGQVRNRPCDGGERAVANAVVVVKRPSMAIGPKQARTDSAGQQR